MSDIVKLVRTDGVSMNNDEIAQWLEAWTEQIRSGKPLRTLMVIVEDLPGEIDIISTGRPLDQARMVGLLEMAKHRRMNNDLDFILRGEVEDDS